MKILHLIAGAARGGAETFAMDAIVALHERGVEQLVLCRGHDNFVRPLRAANIPHEVFTFARWRKWLERTRVSRRIESYSPDVVHCWMARAADFTPKGKGVPVLGWFGSGHNLKYYSACDYYMGVSGEVVEHIGRASGRPERVFLVNTFGTLREDAPVSREEFGIPEGKPVILMLARMHTTKGVDLLLRACADLDVFLLLAGDGPEMQSYQKLARDLGLESRVCFAGWRQDRSALLDLADVVAVPSRNDAAPTVMAETWGKGVALVAARADGPRQFIEHGVNGMLSDVEDVAGLAKNLRAVLDDDALRERLVAGGRHTYETIFSKEIVVSKLLSAYEEIVRRGVV